MSLADSRLVIVDLETFGLNPRTDSIIELGILIATTDFRVVGRFSTLVWEGSDNFDYNVLKSHAKSNESAKIVLDMHEKSGLWQEARYSGVSRNEAVGRTLDWLDLNGFDGTDPMTGSSVDFDRGMLKEQMPEIEQKFFRRNIDVSSIKELCKRFNPSVASKLEVITQPKKLHRSLSDCEDTLNELRFYYDNFLWT